MVQIGLDYGQSKLDDQDKAMLAFAEKVNETPNQLCKEDIARLRDVGFSDENILDIIASVAYRNFSNRLNIALGLDDPENLSKLDPQLKEMLDSKAANSA